MKALISRKVVEPLQAVLKQGLSRHELALTLAVGVVVATFPVFGVTTFLCMLVAARLGLNQVVIQVANYAGYPLQFALFIPLIRFGEFLLGLTPVAVNPEAVTNLLWHHPLQFVQVYGMSIGAACLAWLVLAIPIIWCLKRFVLLFLAEKTVE